MTDAEIKAFIEINKKAKSSRKNYINNMKVCAQFLRKDINLEDKNGIEYILKLRKSSINPFDFSIILGMNINGNFFRLARYNGKHTHRNKLENEVISGFHIHKATERYQSFDGSNEDGYAQETDQYSSFEEAFDCFCCNCNVTFKNDDKQNKSMEEQPCLPL